MGSQRRAKAAIQTQRTIHKGGPDCCEEQLGTPCSLSGAPQDREIHPRGLTALVKSCL